VVRNPNFFFRLHLSLDILGHFLPLLGDRPFFREWPSYQRFLA
jgi:hypothetical protein